MSWLPWLSPVVVSDVVEELVVILQVLLTCDIGIAVLVALGREIAVVSGSLVASGDGLLRRARAGLGSRRRLEQQKGEAPPACPILGLDIPGCLALLSFRLALA